MSHSESSQAVLNPRLFRQAAQAGPSPAKKTDRKELFKSILLLALLFGAAAALFFMN